MVDQPKLDGHDTHHEKVWYNEDLAVNYEVISIKASEGIAFDDPEFEHRWSLLRDHGVRYRCAYAWPRPNRDIKLQFDNFKSIIDQQGGLRQGEFTMCDVEETKSLAPNGFLSLAQVAEWMGYAEAAWPGRNINYCNKSWPSFFAWRSRFPDYPLWYAHWPNLNDPLSLGRAWANVNVYKATMWQWTDHAAVPGITFPVDGDMIIDRARLDVMTTQNTEVDDVENYYVVTGANAKFIGTPTTVHWTGPGSKKIDDAIAWQLALGNLKTVELTGGPGSFAATWLEGPMPTGDSLYDWVANDPFAGHVNAGSGGQGPQGPPGPAGPTGPQYHGAVTGTFSGQTG